MHHRKTLAHRLYSFLLLSVLLSGFGLLPFQSYAQQRATFANAISKVMPAVVNIYSTRHTPGNPAGAAAMADPLMQNLYGQRAPIQQKVARSLGSGVIVKPEGIVVTNLHVIKGADDVRIGLSDGREFPAKFLNGDEKTDLAVLQLILPSNAKVPSAEFGDSTTLRVGDVILALGNPFGIGQSATMGIVSAVDRSNAGLGPYAQFIQTDAAINPGNSGGALIDTTGKLVGINTAIFTRTGGTMGISFAIPASVVQAVVGDIVRTGSVVRPWFGAEGQALNPTLAERLKQEGGVYLNSIMPGSPAQRAGLQSGDLILALDGKPVTGPADLNERLLATPDITGKESTVTVLRDGEKQTLPIRFESLPARNPTAQRRITGYSPLSGMAFEQLSPALNVEIGLPMKQQGVAVISRGQPQPGVQQLDLRPGDIILSINRTPVRVVSEVAEAAEKSKRNWSVQVQRQSPGGPRTVTVTNY